MFEFRAQEKNDIGMNSKKSQGGLRISSDGDDRKIF